MTRLRGWKAWAAGSVSLLFVGCCALGAAVDKTKPNATLVIDTAIPTKTASLTPTIVPSATPRATLEPTATIKPKAVVPTVVPTALKAADAPTATTEDSSVVQSGDSYPCADGQIKGNINSNKYHIPTGQSYAKTVENVICFNTAAEAEAAGFIRAKR